MKINWDEFYKNIEKNGNKVLTKEEREALIAEVDEENSLIENFEYLEVAF